MICKLSLDKLALIITSGTTVLFVGILVFQIPPLFERSPVEALALGFFLIGVYLYSVLNRPLHYEVTPDIIEVKRPVRNYVIKRKDIVNVRLFPRDKMKFTIRTFGVGGLFGYYGYFSNYYEGRLRMFASRRDKTVLIELSDSRKIILSPDDPELLINVLSLQVSLGPVDRSPVPVPHH